MKKIFNLSILSLVLLSLSACSSSEKQSSNKENDGKEANTLVCTAPERGCSTICTADKCETECGDPYGEYKLKMVFNDDKSALEDFTVTLTLFEDKWDQDYKEEYQNLCDELTSGECSIKEKDGELIITQTATGEEFAELYDIEDISYESLKETIESEEEVDCN